MLVAARGRGQARYIQAYFKLNTDTTTLLCRKQLKTDLLKLSFR